MSESVELLNYWIELDKFNCFKAKRLNRRKTKVGVRGNLAEYLQAVKLLNLEASIAYAKLYLDLKEAGGLLCYYEFNSDCILYTVYDPDGMNYHLFTTIESKEAINILSGV